MTTTATLETRTVNLERFRHAVGFTATFKCWGNSRKAPIDQISTKTEAAKEGDTTLAAAQDKKAKIRLKLSKTLIVSEEYEAIKSFFGELRAWTYERTVPSFFKEGFQLAHESSIQPLVDRYEKARNEDLPALVETFLAAYPQQVLNARNDLEPVGLFNAAEYPATEELRAFFGIQYHFIAFTVPEGLPPELRAAEEDKLKKIYSDAGEQMTLMLRAELQEMIAHATEKLTTAPGEKPRVFRDSLLGNIHQFIEAFQSRNLMDDKQLAALVQQSKEILIGITPQKLRDLAAVRENTRKQFEAIKTSLDGLIVIKASRKFSFDEPAPAPETPSVADRPEAPAMELSAV